MGWFKKALTISTPDKKAYYTVVDPGEFYEWRFNGSIPKGTIFTKHLPKTESFINGSIIVSAILNEDNLSHKGHTYILKNNDPTEPFLEVGQIQSPNEILMKFNSLREKFHNCLTNFKKTLDVRKYIVTANKTPCIYKIESHDEHNVNVDNYGSVPEILDSVLAIEQKIRYNDIPKTGRSYELEKVNKFMSALSYLKNKDLSVDSNKLETIISFAGLKPKTSYKINITECMINTSDDVKTLSDLIGNYQKLSWIKSSLRR